MPKQIVISKLGGPEVLNYQEYTLPKNINTLANPDCLKEFENIYKEIKN